MNLEQAQAEEQVAKEKYFSLVRDKDQVDAEIRKLRGQVRKAEQAASRASLRPGTTHRRDDPSPEIERLETKIQDLQTAQSRAKKEWDEARERVRQIARETLREEGGIADQLRAARKAEDEATRNLGRMAREKFKDVEQATDQRKELEAEVNQLLAVADAKSSQERDIEDYVSPDRPPSLDSLAGNRILSELRWVANLSETDKERIRNGESVVRSVR